MRQGDAVLRVAFVVLYLTALVAGAALGLSVLVDGYTPVPFADFWSQFDFIRRALEGDVGIADFWAQHNEHRIAIARLQFLLDYGLFDGTNVSLYVLIVLSLLGLAAVFAAAVQLETGDAVLALGTFAAATASAMSAAGWENLTWAFQGQFVQVFLFAALAILLVVIAARTSPGRARGWLVAITAATAVAATYSMANGLFVWVVVVGLALALSLGRNATAVLTIVGVLATASYLWRLAFTTTGGLSDPVDLATFVCVYLGSAVWGAGIRASGLLGAAGLVVVAALAVAGWRRRRTQTIALPFGVGVGAFVLLTAGQTAAGRLHLGTSQALASRYSIASSTFLLALMVGMFVLLRERFAARPNVLRSYLALAAVAALVISFRTIPDPDFQRITRFGKEVTVLTYYAGVTDDSGTVTGVAAGDALAETLEWMHAEGLGPWAPNGFANDMLVTEPHRAPDVTCAGGIETSESVKRGHRLRGWIAPPPGAAPSRNIVVLDEHGARAGLGLVGMRRLDAGGSGQADFEWNGFVAYVTSEPRGRLDLVLMGTDRRTPLCTLGFEPVGA